MDNYWICDTCGEKIRSPEDGRLEWFSHDDEKGMHRRSSLRLVHELSASPLRKMNLKRNGCAFDLHQEQFRTDGAVDNRPLGEFLGTDGLVRLLSLVSEGEFPLGELLKMIKRLHVPGYEMARPFILKAALQGIIERDAKDDHCNQADIAAVLKWVEETGR